MKSTPLYFRISTTLEIPRVPRSWRSVSACLEKGCGCAVDSSALTGSIPMDRASGRSSILQLLNCSGSPLALIVFNVKMRHRLLYMLLAWPSVVSLALVKLDLLQCCWPDYWSLTLA